MQPVRKDHYLPFPLASCFSLKLDLYFLSNTRSPLDIVIIAELFSALRVSIIIIRYLFFRLNIYANLKFNALVKK